jgi:murein DD-endopeptidase MepM/ murein hydrolase activator NlpD
MRPEKLGLCALILAVCLAAGTRPGPQGSSAAAGADLSRPGTETGTQGIEESLFTGPDLPIRELPGYRWVEGEVARGENLNQLLRRAGVESGESLGFARALERVFDPRRARPGDRYEIALDPENHVHRFVYRRSRLEVYRAVALPAGGDRAWSVERLQIPIEHRTAELAGRVTGSLYGAFVGAGADADLTMAFVELFGWDVDFSREAREGDEFRVIYEKLFVAGESVGNGRMLAAQYVGACGKHNAVYYKSDRIEGYFDPEGRSVRKSFRRSPLEFARITSRFSRGRRHPVLKVVRAHNGVDYAAPAGTAVWSVADGTVAFAGWKGQAGKTVAILHAKGYETSYNHLSRFAKGIQKGAPVKQGETIGYVGRTGLATGPHLDFRVKKDGQWVDPLKEKYVAGDPVPEDERGRYRAWARAWIDRLEGLVCGMHVAREEIE